jgi:hypothetical protein
MSTPNPYQLLVEGAEDKRVIPELIEKHGIIWEPTQGHYHAKIEDCVGIDNILKDSFISTRFKGSGLQALGIIVDADGLNDSHPSRVPELLNRCMKIIPEFEWTLSSEGIIATDQFGKRLGVWVMPDNLNPGMLENLLLTLPPNNQLGLVEQARSAALNAKTCHDAPYALVHEQKAVIHTWLAWQNPPGRQLHQAIQENLLQPHSQVADAFVDWFRRLFPIRDQGDLVRVFTQPAS